jgi:uncharacterized protein (DUF2252 family)
MTAMAELSTAERAARGKALRSGAPRSSHAAWDVGTRRHEPVALLEEQAASRVPELLPIRYGRMAASPFAFFRGSAYPMAADLATTPRSGLEVQLCGDAHLSNFGGFASPERELVFDINDFDETLPGPWEWDVKRLAASIAVAGRENGFAPARRRRVVRASVAEYRSAMRRFAGMTALEVWYSRLDASAIRSQASRRQAKLMDEVGAKGRRRDSARAFAKLVHEVDGDPRIAPDPPLIVPIEDLVSGEQAHDLDKGLRELTDAYRSSLPPDRRRLLDRYRHTHAARKVVGVGSVGTRAWVVLMLGGDGDDPLFIQAKEAERSVLEPFTAKSAYDNQGQRVVEGQRLMQAASDILLGWLRTKGIDGKWRDFYLRQLWDWKTSAEVETMRPADMAVYARMCSWTLARAHARSGDPAGIAGYLGSGDVFDRAIAEFAEAYADQNERDYRALLDAIDAGRVAAEPA